MLGEDSVFSLLSDKEEIMQRLSLTVRTGNLDLAMALLKIMPGLKGPKAYDATISVSACQSFLRSIGGKNEEECTRRYIEAATSDPIEQTETDDTIIFRFNGACLSVAALTNDSDEIVGWELDFAVDTMVMRDILDTIDATPPLESCLIKTKLLQGRRRTSTEALRQSITATAS